MPKTCCNTVMLRERCTIQQDANEEGAHHPDYSGPAYATSIPCDVMTISGDETFRGRQLEAHTSHVVKMRYRSGVTQRMRLLVTTGIYKDQILNITAVRPIREQGRPMMLELYCRELSVV